jgi:hypothetical protein
MWMCGADLDGFPHLAQTIAISGRSYRLKEPAAAGGKGPKNKSKSKSNESLAAGSAS